MFQLPVEREKGGLAVFRNFGPFLKGNTICVQMVMSCACGVDSLPTAKRTGHVVCGHGTHSKQAEIVEGGRELDLGASKHRMLKLPLVYEWCSEDNMSVGRLQPFKAESRVAKLEYGSLMARRHASFLFTSRSGGPPPRWKLKYLGNTATTAPWWQPL